MLYLSHSEDDGWDFRAYEQHLNAWRPTLPPDLMDLLDGDRLYLNSEGTLHDAYICSLERRFEPPVIGDVERRQQLRLGLVGRYADRIFELSYADIESFHTEREWDAFNHLDVHELIRDSEGRFRHLLQFRNGAMTITCRSVSFVERLL